MNDLHTDASRARYERVIAQNAYGRAERANASEYELQVLAKALSDARNAEQAASDRYARAVCARIGAAIR